MAASKENIAALNAQHKVFIQEKELYPKYPFGIHHVQVLTGDKWLIYRDGRLIKQFDKAGPYTWWNGFLHKWTAQIINTRVELYDIEAKGRVKGPSLSKEMLSAQTAELACEVTADLELSVKIVEVENFIQYRNPLSVFEASINNILVELIGQLPYDQYGQWATVLRDLVRDRLQGSSQGGRDDSERRVGIRVEEVFVTEFKPSTVSDRNVLQMYQLIERARRELIEAQANAQRDGVVARSYAEQGATLNIAPSILALQNSPVGKALIDRDAELQGLMVQAGLHPGSNYMIQQQPVDLQAVNQAPVVGYLRQPQTTTPLAAASGSLASAPEITGNLSKLGDNSGPLPASPFMADEPLIDPSRQNSELAALQQAGFIPAGSGKVSPRYDEQGRPVEGSKEWVLQVTWQRPSGFLTIIFYCPANYPAAPPRVQIRSRAATGSGATWIEPNTVRNWHPGRTLSEVAQEINQSLPPS
ncbi:MAG TPA: SPFH domain-containing protein [Ktedonosporobacter sp.]|nr:SPFH domain-containing protein [Ktedonosporobacter sp.]